MKPWSPIRVVLMTAPDEETGAGIARALVEEDLAACGNLVGGVRSIYRWEGAVQDDAEVLVILKTSAHRVDDMMARARALHPYEVPELLALAVVEVDPGYADWVVRSTRGEKE